MWSLSDMGLTAVGCLTPYHEENTQLHVWAGPIGHLCKT